MGELAAIDVACLGLLALAVLRGLFIGMIREAFSLAALAAAVVAVRLGTADLAVWLQDASGIALGPLAGPVVAGGLLAAGAILAVALVGRLIQRGVRAAGLGLVDRLGGGVLGAAEGALAAAVLVAVLVSALGANHPALAGSRSLAAFEGVERIAGGTTLPGVASPPN